jgi:hypothetical protein
MPTTVVYDPTPALDRSRVTVFFRGILWIPHYFTLLLYGIGYSVSVVLAWFAIIFTGKYPQGLYDFNVKVLKYQARLNSYLYLQVDAYPPFGLDDYPDYPTQLRIGPAQESYSRAKAFFRGLLGIPVVIVMYAMLIVMGVMTAVIWVVGVIAGKTPEGLHGPLNLALSYYARAGAYFALVTEDWPAISQDPGTVAAASPSPSPSSGSAPPPPPPPAPAMTSPFGE